MLYSDAGRFALSFDGPATGMLPVNVSAAAMTTALMGLRTVGELEVFQVKRQGADTFLYSVGARAHLNFRFGEILRGHNKAGQPAGAVDEATGKVLSGNEDLGVRALTLELYGCEQAADTRAVCGDGLVFSPEQCDLGALEATGATEAEARAAAQAAVGAVASVRARTNSSRAPTPPRRAAT